MMYYVTIFNRSRR